MSVWGLPVGEALNLWREANRRHLTAALEDLRLALCRLAGQSEGSEVVSPPATEEEKAAVDLATAEAELAELGAMSSLHRLAALFGLSGFDARVLLLAAAVELNAETAALCAAAQGAAGRPYPTFGLALAAFPEANWGALSPHAPLRAWRLIKLEEEQGLTAARLTIDEQILHALVGIFGLNPRLEALSEPSREGFGLSPVAAGAAERIARTWERDGPAGERPLIELCGRDAAARHAVASSACRRLGLEPVVLPARALPPIGPAAAELIRLCEREFLLGNRVVLLECDDEGAAESGPLEHVAESLRAPLILSLPERRGRRRRPTLTVELETFTVAEQQAMWRETCGIEVDRVPGLERQIGLLSSQFRLGLSQMRAAGAEAVAAIAAADAEAAEGAAAVDARRLGAALWQASRAQARPQLDDLAQRIEPKAVWDDLVVPPAPRWVLQQIAVQVRERYTVYQDWGFAARSDRGLGITALFAGVSGTGKTLAAEVLARHLGLDLYRIDLATVVSKYIGETEKNLRRVFDAAEAGGAILLFDEADALFGKRSEVKDSHDRFANIEISYLLQRMEAYSGLAILTTNLKDALDLAFQRRLRFVVDFAFPDARLRADIWRGVFPAGTPTEGLEPERLAQLNLAGGGIHNVALSAAFLAADEGGAVTTAHIARAARAEYAKLGRLLTDAELAGWAPGAAVQ